MVPLMYGKNLFLKCCCSSASSCFPRRIVVLFFRHFSGSKCAGFVFSYPVCTLLYTLHRRLRHILISVSFSCAVLVIPRLQRIAVEIAQENQRCQSVHTNLARRTENVRVCEKRNGAALLAHCRHCRRFLSVPLCDSLFHLLFRPGFFFRCNSVPWWVPSQWIVNVRRFWLSTNSK